MGGQIGVSPFCGIGILGFIYFAALHVYWTLHCDLGSFSRWLVARRQELPEASSSVIVWSRSSLHMQDQHEEDAQTWLKFGCARIQPAGLPAQMQVFAGLLAGAFAMAVAKMLGYEMWFPSSWLRCLSWVAEPQIRDQCGFECRIDRDGVSLHGSWDGLCAFPGLNSLPLLLGAGFTWGCFSWIFINNSRHFRIFLQRIYQKRPGFSYYGFDLSLTSGRIFDRMVRGNSSR